MNILYLDQTGKLGGGEIALLPWLEARPHGAKVLLFEDGPFRDRLRALGVPVEILASRALQGVRRESGFQAALRTLPTLLHLRARIARQARSFDVLYANSQKAFILGCLARRRGQPLIWHLRDILTADHFSPLMRRLAVTLGNRAATRILVNSEATAQAFRDAGGDPAKVRVVHDGVSALPFDRVPPDEIEARRTELLGSGPGHRFLVGLFGRLSPWKGQLVLLDAVAQTPHAEAVLVGDALFGEDAYKQQILTRAAQPDLAGRVHLLGFRHDIPALMRAMDVVVHTSTAPEPFGLVIVEGMLAGKPVVATAAGGALEIVEDGTSGLLTPPGDAAALASTLRRLLADPGLRQKLASAGRHRASTVFSTEALVRSTEAALAGL